MQQTKFDRWLKESFIYETHIFTLRLPEAKLPRSVKVTSLESKKAGDYKYRLISKSRKQSERLISQLKENHLMYATHIVEKKHWYNSIISPEQKSFTYQLIFRVLALISLFSLCWWGYKISQNTALMELLRETLKDLG